MEQLTISGSQFRDMILAGAALLERNRSYIDSLNVFPVPDGDTGTNMTMTMQGAVKELQSLPEGANASAVADALSKGALRGARGNSGVILSQLFRGFSKAFKGAEVIDAQLLAAALTKGSESAYKAVMKPKEGTILTVSRMIAKAVSDAAAEGANVYRLFDIILCSGQEALDMTPDLLPVLKEAGVVDSGGKGLLTVYQGFKCSLDGDELPEAFDMNARQEQDEAAEDADTASAFGYAAEFSIIRFARDFKESDLDSLKKHLARHGDHVCVKNEADGTVSVRVSTDAPGKALQLAIRIGDVDNIKITNTRELLRQQTEDRKNSEKEYAMIAVCAGDGLESVFKELTVDHVISGGQTMNPSIDSIAGAIYKVNARNVFVLPNNSNIILAAQQAAKLSDCNVIVLPTKTVPQGISAAMAFDPSASPEENTESMTASFRGIVSGSVTYAVRNTKYHGEEIHEGDILGMLDNDICSTGTDVNDTTMEVIRQMVDKLGDTGALLTIFYGSDCTEAQAQVLQARVEEAYPDAEVMLQNGGQPLYYYFLSAEV